MFQKFLRDRPELAISMRRLKPKLTRSAKAGWNQQHSQANPHISELPADYNRPILMVTNHHHHHLPHSFAPYSNIFPGAHMPGYYVNVGSTSHKPVYQDPPFSHPTHTHQVLSDFQRGHQNLGVNPQQPYIESLMMRSQTGRVMGQGEPSAYGSSSMNTDSRQF